ncbi:MAG: hypothetical protein J6Y20_05405 [Lachnospiraceae bacterium]|nr:hypothetical protein [Lachnospiraceae bacterium]
MLTLKIIGKEQWNERTEEFVSGKDQILTLEHSLVSISKWESKWKKPFLSKNEKTFEETVDYVRCMTLTQNVDPNVYNCLSMENIKQVNDYISLPMTATTFYEDKNSKLNHEVITSELIYYWMISMNIPFECQKWHLNRLLTLIRVCSIKSQPSKKMSRREILNRNAALNAARRKQLNSTG